MNRPHGEEEREETYMKKSIILLMALSITAITAMPVKTTHATESTTEASADVEAGQTGTGDKMSPCTVTFCITDESEGYPGNKIKAVMADVTGTITDEYTFTPANSWNENVCPKYSMVAPATYNVTFEGLEDGYAVVNTLDYSSDIKIAATPEGSIDVYWSIIQTGSAGGDIESRLVGGEDRYDIGNEEAEQVFRDFLSQVEFIAEDETWDNFFKTYKIFSHEEWYGKYVKDGKEEDYTAMSLFDRFVWDETYLRFCDTLNSGDSNMFFGSEDSFRTKFLDVILNCMTGNNNEQVKEAYETMAMWQYNYITEHRVPFNFINNRSYIEEIDGQAETTEPSGKKEIAEKEEPELDKEEQKELEQAKEELMEDMDKKDIEGENGGVWDDTINLLSKNLVTIGVLLLLIVVAGIVIWKRKQLNIDGDDR